MVLRHNDIVTLAILRILLRLELRQSNGSLQYVASLAAIQLDIKLFSILLDIVLCSLGDTYAIIPCIKPSALRWSEVFKRRIES